MREKIVLGSRAVNKRVRLPVSTFFVARYERISRGSLPRNIRVTRTRTVVTRNRGAKNKKKGKVQPSEYTNTRQGQKNKKKTKKTKTKTKKQEIRVWKRTSSHNSKSRSDNWFESNKFGAWKKTNRQGN